MRLGESIQSLFVSKEGIFFFDRKVEQINPSRLSAPQTLDAASVTNFTVRSTACVWHGSLENKNLSLRPSFIIDLMSFDDILVNKGGSVTFNTVQSIKSM